LDSRSLSKWGAFQSEELQTVTDLGGHYTDDATFEMAPTGYAFTLTYRWKNAMWT